MLERGIIFNAEMVRAVLEGRKTQTRRIMKVQPHAGVRSSVFVKSGFEDGHGKELVCPFGAIGDRLWVRESYRMPESLDHYSPQQVAEMALGSGYSKPWAPIQLEADGVRTGKWSGFNTPPMTTEPGKLRPSIHMPRWASRITLEITGVRVEHLQDISESDAVSEGIEPLPLEPDMPQFYHEYFPIGIKNGLRCNISAASSFSGLWEAIYGKESWQANPWVWVIEFKRVDGVHVQTS